MDRPLRLISSNPLDKLARTLEGLLVVAAQPLSTDELAEAADEDGERVETALGLLRERYREGRSGIVLERVAGGYAFRAAREAATRARGCSSGPSSAGCRRRRSRPSRSSRTSVRARGRTSLASAAWRRMPRSQALSSAA